VLYSALGVPAAGLAAIRELVEQAADVDDLAAPPVALLTREDLRANPSVELDQLLVDREHGTRARSTDLSLEASKQLGIAVRKGRSEKGLTADHCLHYRNVAGHLPSQLPAAHEFRTSSSPRHEPCHRKGKGRKQARNKPSPNC
jgi:hypothetical protein